MTRGYRRWRLRREQSIRDISVHGSHHLQRCLDEGQGILLTPNHAAHYDSAALYLAADQIPTPLYFMTAWQVFGMSSRWDRFLMQRLGCFSIDRESTDRRAFKQAVHILRNCPQPLVIFPEGDIYHITDRVTAFREGAAAIAVAAARKSSRPVSVIPCGIKFWYQDDPTHQLHEVMTRLDNHLFLHPKPRQALPERVYRFAEALLSLKEIEYFGATRSGTLTARIGQLAREVLQALETRYGLRPTANQIPERVKNLRQAIIRLVEQEDTIGLGRETLAHDMEDLFFVMQLYSYPGDYLHGDPSVERLAETLDKFEEDVFGQEIPSIKGKRRVEIHFGSPIEVTTQWTGRDGVSQLTQHCQHQVQCLIDHMSRAPQPRSSGDQSERGQRRDVTPGSRGGRTPRWTGRLRAVLRPGRSRKVH